MTTTADSGRKILLVTDKEEAYQSLVGLLRHDNYSVKQITDEQEAIIMLQEEQFDLVLLAGASEAAIGAKIEKTFPEIEIIVIAPQRRGAEIGNSEEPIASFQLKQTIDYACEKRRLLRNISFFRRIEQLQQAVLKLGATILTEKNIDHILQIIVDAVVTHSDFSRAALSLYDLSLASPIDGKVQTIAAAGISPQELQRLTESGGLSPHDRHCIFTKQFKHGPAYYIPHNKTPWKDTQGIPGTVTTEGWHRADLLLIPLRGEKGIIGHLSIDDPHDGNIPTITALEPITILTNMAALAIERVYKLQQLEKLQEKLHRVYDFGQTMLAAVDIPTLLESTLRRLQGDFKYDLGAIWFKEKNELVARTVVTTADLAGDEWVTTGTRISLDDKGAVPWVARQGTPLVIPDVNEDERHNRPCRTAHSEIIVPVMDKKEMIGLLQLESKRLACFTQEDIALLTAVASQLTSGIVNLRKRDELQRIYTFSRQLAQIETLSELTEVTLDWLDEHFGYYLAAILLKEGSGLIVLGLRRLEMSQRVKAKDKFSFDKGIVGWAAKHRESVIVDDVTKNGRYILGYEDTRSELAVPIIHSEELLGVLNIESSEPARFDEQDRQAAESIAGILAVAISNIRAQEELRQQAIHDALTGLYNRHYFNTIIDNELARTDRYNRPLSFMMIDIDGFKAVNDELGHLKGDEILKRVAGMLQKNVRSTDRVIRYGGDEFLILLPETNGEAKSIAKRLKEQTQQLNRDLSLFQLNIGLSIGIVTRQANDNQDLEKLLREADRLMYEDKYRTSENAR